MPFSGIADPHQLTILDQVLDDYCRRRHIVAASSARHDAARRIMLLFRSGVTEPAALNRALNNRTTLTLKHPDRRAGTQKQSS